MNIIDRIRFFIYRQEKRRKYFEEQEKINSRERKEEYEKEFQKWAEKEAKKK